MADQEISVKISADVKSLLQGMKDSQSAISSATDGMKGDLGSLIESLEKVGPAALALGAVGLAFEGLKAAKDTIMEAVHSTDELARSFETLHMRTGASYEDLTLYKNAMVLTGGSLGDFSALLTGLARKMSSNSEIYIANGIAANKSALDHQDLMTTLAKSVQVITSIEDPGRRAEMAIALLGGRAQAMLPQIMRMNEVIEKDGVEALRKLGATIDNEAVAKHEKLEHAIGGVKLEIEKIDQVLAESGRGWAVWGTQLDLAWHKITLAVTDAKQWALPDLLGDENRKVVSLQAQWGKDGSLPKVEGGDGGKPTAGGGGGVTPAELAAKKAAHEQSIAISKGAAAEELKVVVDGVEARLKADQHLVAMNQMDFEEMTANAKASALEKFEAQKVEADKEIKLAEGNALQIAAIRNKLADDYRKYDATIQDLDAKAAENSLKTADKLAKDILHIAKIEADGTVAIQKLVLTERDKFLDQELATGRISSERWVALKRDAAFQAERIDLDMLNRELADANGDLVKIAAIEQKKLAIIQKTANDTVQVERTAAEQTDAIWQQAINRTTQGWDVGIQKMLHGQMTLTQGIGSALKQFEDQTEKALINVGLYWAKHFLLQKTLQEDAHMKQVFTDAKSAAAGAWNATVGIPFIGPVLAPIAAAASFAGVMAFAEGGWGNVPSDQVAMIHKQEMVLPKDIANPLRESLASGGGLGGSVHLHMNNMDSASFSAFLSNPANKRAVLQMFQGAMRNGRMA